MTQSQRERIAEAYDILRGVFAEIRDKRGMARPARLLDTILAKIENFMFYGD